MDADQLIKATKTTQRLIQDEYFYKYIFKRTERIVSVVFYITQSVSHDALPDTVRTDLEDAARTAHAAVLRSLEARAHTADEALFANVHSLIALESHLQVAESMGVLSKDVFGVLSGEIDAAIRSTNKYMQHDPIAVPAVSLAAAAPKTTATHDRQTGRKTVTTPTPAPTAVAEQSARRAQILTIIEARGEVGVKDISTIIKDISEKTIQRELNDMIEEGLIIREGERRWSKYKVL